jgi:hypothetical protein
MKARVIGGKRRAVKGFVVWYHDTTPADPAHDADLFLIGDYLCAKEPEPGRPHETILEPKSR